MRNSFIIVTLLCGVFGDIIEVKSVSVMEGDSVTLHINVTDNTVRKILWRFALEDTGPYDLIAEINMEKKITYKPLEGFIGRLDLNILTGDLTIKNTRIKHTGHYKAVIVRSGETNVMFNVTVKESPHDVSAGTDEETVLKTKGGLVTLDTGVQTQRGDLILWRFGDDGVLIAKDDKEDNKSPIYYDGGSKDRLQVNNQTGSLTISDVRPSDSGLYKLKISSNSKQTLYKTFIVSVSDEQGLSGGSIAGIVLCVLLSIAGVIVVAVIWSRRRVSALKNQTVKEKKVKERDSVILDTWVTELKSGDVIELSFKETVIVGVIKEDTVEFLSNVMFKDRLRVDLQTGSLIITNMRTEDAGMYKVKISSSSRLKSFRQFITGGGPSYCQFNVLVYEEKLVVDESSVTLHPHTEIQSDDEFEWMFEDEVITKGNRKISDYSCDDERFSGKLEFQNKTGSLTIKNFNRDMIGFYKVKITSSKGTSYCLFKVITEEIMAVIEGESVTLRTGLYVLPKGTKIEWIFKDEVIITGRTGNKDTFSKYVGNDVRFKDRLKPNNINGYLSIRDIEKSNEGLYKVNITTGEKTSVLRYFVTVVDVMKFASLFGSAVSCNKEITSAQGESVTLHTNVTEIQKDDKIVWRFGNYKMRVARFTGGTSEPLCYDLDDNRFKNKLKMDKKTGNLTIENITLNITGYYGVEIRNKSGTTHVNFIVALPVFAEVGGEIYLKTEGVQKSDFVQWIFKDKVLATKTNGENVLVPSNTKYTERLNLDVESGSLTITNVNDTDFGVYTLKHMDDRRIMSDMKFSVACGTGNDLQPSAGRRMKPETDKTSGKDLKPSAGRQRKSETETESIAVNIPLMTKEAEDRV